MITTILTIAGSDCSGGAGIQADIKTITHLGGYAASVITAITAQNTLGVQAVYPLPAEILTSQLTSVFEDLKPQAVKIGMLPQAETIHIIARMLKTYQVTNVVCDPVMISTSGKRLMEPEAVKILLEELFPCCTLITPNLHEASFLCGQSLSTIDEMKETAALLSQKHQTSVLIKGGHLQGNEMCDILFEEPTRLTYSYSSCKIDSANLHGTGCTLSSAIATCLAQGLSLSEAVQEGKSYMNLAIERGKNLHVGQGNGPLWHGETPFLNKESKKNR